MTTFSILSFCLRRTKIAMFVVSHSQKRETFKYLFYGKNSEIRENKNFIFPENVKKFTYTRYFEISSYIDFTRTSMIHDIKSFLPLMES